MNSMDALRAVAADAGVPITHIGRAMGKRDNYVSVAINKGTDPKAGTLAAMAEACGYALVLLPADDVPDGAVKVDPPAKGERG